MLLAKAISFSFGLTSQGYVVNWDIQTQIWSRIFGKALLNVSYKCQTSTAYYQGTLSIVSPDLPKPMVYFQIDPKHSSLLMTEPFFNPR